MTRASTVPHGYNAICPVCNKRYVAPLDMGGYITVRCCGTCPEPVRVDVMPAPKEDRRRRAHRRRKRDLSIKLAPQCD